MRDSPIRLADSDRVLRHPDTPAAYVAWREILPIICDSDREHLGNLLEWSWPAASRSLGASRRLFERAFSREDEVTLDRWMMALADTSVEAFVDHLVPFLRNYHVFHLSKQPVRSLLSQFLDELATNGPQHKLLRELPEVVHLEVTRSCNFACGMCSSRTAGHLPSKTMPLPAFGEFVRVLAPSAKTIRVNGYGESTIVPGFISYLDCLDEFGFQGTREIITNMSGPAAVYGQLADRGFVVMASWDATEPRLFERLRRGASYSTLLQNLDSLAKCLRASPERLLLLATIQRENLAEIVPLVEFASTVGAGGVIFNMINEEDDGWMDERFSEISSKFEVAAEHAKDLGVRAVVPDHIGRRRLKRSFVTRSSARFCDRPYLELLVRWDGEATVCNMFNPFSYGTLLQPGPPRSVPERLRRIWYGPNARVFRTIINTFERHPYCDDCYFLHS